MRERGQLALRRTYVFDYTANSIERRQGFVILLGRRVESVGYAPGEERRAQPQPPPVTISLSATCTPPPPAEADEPQPARKRQSCSISRTGARAAAATDSNALTAAYRPTGH